MKYFLVLVAMLVSADLAFVFGTRFGEEYGIALGEFNMINNCTFWMEKQKERLEKQCEEKNEK